MLNLMVEMLTILRLKVMRVMTRFRLKIETQARTRQIHFRLEVRSKYIGLDRRNGIEALSLTQAFGEVYWGSLNNLVVTSQSRTMRMVRASLTHSTTLEYVLRKTRMPLRYRHSRQRQSPKFKIHPRQSLASAMEQKKKINLHEFTLTISGQ